MKKYLHIALMMLCVIAISTSCKDDDNNDVIDDTWRLQNEAAFQEKANDPEFIKILSEGNNGFIFVKKIKKGNGQRAFFTSRVTVYYRGWAIDKTKNEYFDKLEFEDGEPFRCAVSSQYANYSESYNPYGYSSVISGWGVALQNMVVGDKWEVWIPQELAYGTQDYGNIKGYSTLIFEMELMAVPEVAATN